jgi:ABC-type Mn2+/Zn2+ transport system ATPase subunit
MSVLSLKNVSVTYPSQSEPAVSEVSFKLEKGNLAVLIGPNGSGKSTLLRAILGFNQHKGKISYFGGDIQIKQFSIGYVPQRFEFEHSIPITTEEFMNLALVSCGCETNKKSKMLDETFAKLELLGMEKQLVSELSGGQMQRLLLARAMVHSPKLLILDEPESAADVHAEKLVYSVLKKEIEENDLSVLIASHELEIIRHYADQVICLNKKMICSGKPQNVFKKEVFEKLYGPFGFYAHDHK